MKIELCDGKYTYVLNETTGEQYALRNGEAWRDLTGDKFVMSLAQLVSSLSEELSLCNQRLGGLLALLHRDGGGRYMAQHGPERPQKQPTEILETYTEILLYELLVFAEENPRAPLFNVVSAFKRRMHGRHSGVSKQSTSA